MAAVVPVDLAFVPPSGSTNTVDLTVTVTAYGIPKIDSDSATVSGNMRANLNCDFDPVTRQITALTGLTFDPSGSRFEFSDVSLELNYGILIGKILIDGTDIGGTFQTPNPPGTVSAGDFDTAEHEVVLDQGTLYADGTGLLLNGLFQPMTFDLASEPITGTTEATGHISASLLSTAGYQATYDVTLTLPLSFDQELYNDPDTGITVWVAAEGTFQTYGTFTHFEMAWLIPGDANADGVVDDRDASILGSHWLLQEGATWGDGDFNRDGIVNDKDAAILAAHWGEGGGEESVPEPGSLALLAGIAVMGMIYLRRRKA
jgi:hypothetical protein